ncbi:lactate utilization protein [Candidatus Saccharibacteria bacterium]|nr:lactate utilization protein [Candidatus Saccharibacteria bacterium]MBI3337694.1 lactate utilization protein [Candidatus Saccharibacteria bacterium]
MEETNKFQQLASAEQLKRTVAALETNGISAVVVETGAEAKTKALSLIEKGTSVMTATSTTADQIGLGEAIEESKDFVSLRKKITELPESEQRAAARRINSAPDYVVGSANAVTEDGKVVIASNSGSQLAPYAFSAAHVIWVVGTQKIVANLDEAMKRIEEYTLKLESERLQKIYGMDSVIRKTLIINSEVMPGRITMILVKEKLGF